MEKELGWSVRYAQTLITVDVTKGRIPQPLAKDEDAFTVFKDGPRYGCLRGRRREGACGDAAGGDLWTTEDRIYGRYRRATLPDGLSVPICVGLKSVARLGMTKQEGSKSGHAVGLKEGEGIAVKRWR